MRQYIKFGSNCFIDESNEINYSLLEKKVREIENLEGDSVLVMSGAIKLGKNKEKETKHNSELSNVELQGYSSVGQRILMDLCAQYFSKNVAQILVTMEDMKHENHLKELISENIKKNRISIVNYNDSIDFMELRKDNDTLAAELAVYSDADRLIILGNYDGFIDKNGNLIERVYKIDNDMYALCNGKSDDGLGGFMTKLDAAKIMLKYNKEVIIGNVNYAINDLIEGNVKRTLFRI